VILDRSRARCSCREPVPNDFSEFGVAQLMSEPGRCSNRQELLRAIWGDSGAYRDPVTIDVHSRHLREKLERSTRAARAILTVPRPKGIASRRRRVAMVRWPAFGLRLRLVVALGYRSGAVALGVAAVAVLQPWKLRLRREQYDLRCRPKKSRRGEKCGR